ncbi:hypothetical protein CTI12_AA361040 [Artemisia annua]|uniref:Transmembrane protein n=1 Tax=Artemisia annua TaxID=35608 RepID=A0A2U1MN87_ARTAN|nr:hypothetical protein CTI12_AA361040 [Artemisia annua]
MTNPSPPQLHLQTATQILKKTTTIVFFSGIHHLISFLILSILLFSIQSKTLVITHDITSYIENTPSINSTLTRTNNPPKPTSPITTNRRRKTLDNNFFPGDNELDQRTFLDTLLKTHVNATSFFLDSFDHHVGPTFIEFQENVKENVSSSGSGIMLVFDLKYNEVSTLLGLVRVFCVSYGFMMAAFVVISAWVYGVVFVLVVNDLLKTRKSLYRTFVDGEFLGFNRLARFVGMRLMVRVALSQLLGVFFFRGVKDKFTFVNVWIWLMFLPFSDVSPWVKGYEYEFWWIRFLWIPLNLLFSFVLDAGAWVVMVDSRKRGREAINEGYHLFLLMFDPAGNLKCLEYFICSLFGRTTLKRAFGEKIALAFLSFMEVYFTVVWLMFYFSVKSVDANSKGIPFGQQELEAMVKDVDDRQ